MKTTKLDNDPIINKEIIDMFNKIIEQYGIDYAIKKAEELLLDSENRKKHLISKNRHILNSDSHIDLSKRLIEYLQNIKVEIRNKKLKSLLGEKKILNFNNFKLISELIY
jgi:hypothetical protein